MMENDSDDVIVPESIPSSCPASPLLISGLHNIHKQKQVGDVQINPFDGHLDSENESELSQSLLKPRSAQVYRSPVFPPPSSKVPKLPDPEPDVQERRDDLQDGGYVKLIRDEDESKNDEEKGNENVNDSDSDSTEIEEDRNYISDVIKYSDGSPKRATFLLGHSQINNEDTELLETRVKKMEVANTGIPDAKVLEKDILPCVPEMAMTEAEEPELVAPKAVVQTDQQISEATLKNKSWGDDEEQEALQDLERRLQKLRNGGEPSIHCKLMSIKMQLRLLNESFKEQRTASLKKLANLQRESSKNKQHEKLVNISSKQKVLLKLVKIYKNISNESDVDINISNSSTPDGKRSGDGRQLSRHQSKTHQVKSHEVEYSSHQLRSIQGLPRRDHQRRAATDVDLNLVVKKLISAGLVTSTSAATSSTCSGDSVAPTGGMTQGTSKKGEHSLPDTVLRTNDITSKQVLPTSGSTANPCLEDTNRKVALTKESEDRTSTVKLAIQTGAAVCSSALNQVTNSISAQSQNIVSTNHSYQTTSQSSPCSSMLEKISVKNANTPKVITILKPSKEVENSAYLSSKIAENSRTVMTNQTFRNASLNYAMSKSKGRGLTIQCKASPHPSTIRSNIVTLPSSISTSSISASSISTSSAVFCSATARTSSLSPAITTTLTTAAASQSSFNTTNSLSSDASPAKLSADDQPLKDLLKNCRVSLIDDSELFLSRLYLPESFWTESFASIDLPSALINDIDNWDQCRNE